MSHPPLSPHGWLRYGLIDELLGRVPQAKSFLEIGCGVGALGSRLADRYVYTGYEPDPRSFEIARSRVKRGVVINSFLPSSVTELFDLLGAFEVLEHQEDEHVTLAQWSTWIRPGGHILLSVPANPDRFGRADVAAGHYRRYSASRLAAALRLANLEDVTIWSYGFPLGYLLEFARNRLAPDLESATYETRTSSSGRFYQPNERVGWVTWAGTAPFRIVQRPFRSTSLGTGFVAMARRPL